MAILRRGSRGIVVDGVRLRWRIRRQPTYSQGLGWSPLIVAVAAESGDGSTLILRLNINRPDAWVDASKSVVVPSDIARFVREAMRTGWAPAVAGKPVVRQARVLVYPHQS